MVEWKDELRVPDELQAEVQAFYVATLSFCFRETTPDEVLTERFERLLASCCDGPETSDFDSKEIKRAIYYLFLTSNYATRNIEACLYFLEEARSSAVRLFAVMYLSAALFRTLDASIRSRLEARLAVEDDVTVRLLLYNNLKCYRNRDSDTRFEFVDSVTDEEISRVIEKNQRT